MKTGIPNPDRITSDSLTVTRMIGRQFDRAPVWGGIHLSYVMAVPEIIEAAASTAAASQTTQTVAAAEDEVSAAIATVLSSHGQGYQVLSARALEFHRPSLDRQRRQWDPWPGYRWGAWRLADR